MKWKKSESRKANDIAVKARGCRYSEVRISLIAKW
nr:MAG TPA: hypothetical protein [Caudoviricetes sp.]